MVILQLLCNITTIVIKTNSFTRNCTKSSTIALQKMPFLLRLFCLVLARILKIYITKKDFLDKNCCLVIRKKLIQIKGVFQAKLSCFLFDIRLFCLPHALADYFACFEQKQ